VAGIPACLGAAAANQLQGPQGIAIDQFNHRVQKWIPGATNETRVAGDSSGNGGSELHQLCFLLDVLVDLVGALYIADCMNDQVVYYRLQAHHRAF
jgi:hypothetical protein